LQAPRWGFPPYGALAAELNFCNEAMFECGSLSQGENGLSQGQNGFSQGETILGEG
jgi:hypothetical protein